MTTPIETPEQPAETGTVRQSELIKALGTELVNADAYVCITCKGSSVQVHARGGHLAMLGAIELAKQRFLNKHVEMAEALEST